MISNRVLELACQIREGETVVLQNYDYFVGHQMYFPESTLKYVSGDFVVYNRKWLQDHIETEAENIKRGKAIDEKRQETKGL